MARPNHALSMLQSRVLMLAVAGITGVIALAFAAVGAWLVIPFAGLEIVALWLALRHLQRHADDEERLDIDDTQISIRRHTAGRVEHYQFQRYWAQLRIEHLDGRSGTRLFLRSHGREVEIGRLLTEKQKENLADDLKTRLGAVEQQRIRQIAPEEGN